MSQNLKQISSIIYRLLPWFEHHARDLPWRKTRDPYGIWISEVMLQQTQVKTVIAYWNRWMETFPDVKTLARSSDENVLKLWEGLGYYSRARNLHGAARVIVHEHRGIFPTDFQKILDLPGIGRYTAGAIHSIAFNRPTPIVDGNITRVLSRIFGLAGDPKRRKTQSKLWSLAEQLVMTAFRQRKKTSRTCAALNQGLMELGALICTPRNPQCEHCPLSRQCHAYQHDQIHRFPRVRKRPAMRRQRMMALLCQNQGRWLVRKRLEGGINGGFWEFPALEVHSASTPPKQVSYHLLKKIPEKTTAACQIQHSITSTRITLEAVHCSFAEKTLQQLPGNWKSLRQLETLPLTSAHRKIFHHLRNSKGE